MYVVDGTSGFATAAMHGSPPRSVAVPQKFVTMAASVEADSR
jgi:hypothetical protein